MSDRTNLAMRSDGRTRRQVIAGFAIVAGGIVLRSTETRADTEEISHSAESIHQEPLFKASRARIYEALIDTHQFDKVIQLTSSPSLGTKPTQISREPGGAFTIFGGHIVGRQIELVPNERIVQAWRVDGWNAGIYSIAKFSLVEQGSGTKIVFDHTGFPPGLGKHLAAGWQAHYWEPLRKLIA
jgi:activator of HSP90 ATPase